MTRQILAAPGNGSPTRTTTVTHHALETGIRRAGGAVSGAFPAASAGTVAGVLAVLLALLLALALAGPWHRAAGRRRRRWGGPDRAPCRERASGMPFIHRAVHLLAVAVAVAVAVCRRPPRRRTAASGGGITPQGGGGSIYTIPSPLRRCLELY